MYNLFVDRLSPDSLLMLCEVSDKISLVLPLTHSTGQPRPVNTPPKLLWKVPDPKQAQACSTLQATWYPARERNS